MPGGPFKEMYKDFHWLIERLFYGHCNIQVGLGMGGEGREIQKGEQGERERE